MSNMHGFTFGVYEDSVLLDTYTTISLARAAARKQYAKDHKEITVKDVANGNEYWTSRIT